MLNKQKFFAFTLICLISIASTSFAAKRYVKWDATGGNTGVDWANAYTDLQSALIPDPSVDQIWVAAGTYKPTLGSDASISFVIPSGVSIYGGFTGTESSIGQRNQKDRFKCPNHCTDGPSAPRLAGRR